MSKIYDLTQPFPFNSLTMGTPVARNGNYYMKFSINDAPIYIQPPKSSLKQGFIKSGKKILCDLIFSNENNRFMSWLEDLETFCHNTIYENREKWFENSFEKHEIETLITSPYKMYKSGKYFIVRSSVPNTLGKCDLKVYNENEEEVDIEQVPDNSTVMTILEFKGIKTSSRNFQFEVELKQMLLMKPDLLFEKCIIQHAPMMEKKEPDYHPQQSIQFVPDITSDKPIDEPVKEVTKGLTLCNSKGTFCDTKSPYPVFSDTKGLINNVEMIVEEKIEDIPFTNEQLGSSNTIEEVTFDIDTLQETPVHIKPRNEVYYKLYKDAKQKAKEARLVALSNYLEAKRIKTTYMLEDDSDDEDVFREDS